MRAVRTVKAGLHSFFRMSRQIAPLSLLIFGCHILVSYFICAERRGGTASSEARRGAMAWRGLVPGVSGGMGVSCLWWNKRVVARQQNVDAEEPPLVRCPDGTLDFPLPVEKIALVDQLNMQARRFGVLGAVP